jgi:protein-L-isoaspartate O-methyltransferase
VNGQTLSAISKPSFLIQLINNLDIKEGQHVLEIGSGTGWFLALLSSQVGSTGSVSGVEIIPCLARASFKMLRNLGLGNVTVTQGDADEFKPPIKFDSIIFTSATKELPEWIGNALTNRNGRLAVPIAIPGGGDCMAVFRRTRNSLVSTAINLSVSVPTTGRLMGDYLWAPTYESFCEKHGLIGSEIIMVPWISSPLPRKSFILESLPVRAYLAFRRKGFVAVAFAGKSSVSDNTLGFGLLGDDGRSVALITAESLCFIGPRGRAVAHDLLQEVNRWRLFFRHKSTPRSIRLALPKEGRLEILPAIVSVYGASGFRMGNLKG